MTFLNNSRHVGMEYSSRLLAYLLCFIFSALVTISTSLSWRILFLFHDDFNP